MRLPYKSARKTLYSLSSLALATYLTIYTFTSINKIESKINDQYSRISKQHPEKLETLVENISDFFSDLFK
jgi:hypothetical protein